MCPAALYRQIYTGRLLSAGARTAGIMRPGDADVRTSKRKAGSIPDMAERYKIGKYEFETHEEYVRGMLDVRKIYKITHSIDIYEPEIASRLYQLIRTGKVRFYSKIGRQFFLDLADVVAESVQDGVTVAREPEPGRRFRGNRDGKSAELPEHTDWSRRILGGVCLVAAIACFAWYFWSDYTNHRGNQANEYLKQLQEQSQDLVSNNTFFMENAPEFEQTGGLVGEAVEMAQILPEYSAVYMQNQDFAGWLKIEDTKVDYPVMLTRGDTDYYLGRNFNKEEDINGTLFMDARTNLKNRNTNVIIYGHNMKSGQMFGGLKNYLEESYFTSHKQVTFDTIYEKGTYEIFAVCLAQVQYQSADTFRYYDFIQADTEEAFNEFLANVEQLAVFMSKEKPVYGDELLTLSTCNNFTEDGRLFLIAKRCMDAE